MANAQDERLLSDHDAHRQYGATEHRVVSFDGNDDARSSSPSSSSGSTVDGAGLVNGQFLIFPIHLTLMHKPRHCSHISVHVVPLLAHPSHDWIVLLLSGPVGQVCMVSHIYSSRLSRLSYLFSRPPTAKERAIPHPPQYPHPFLWQPCSIGMLASICVQAMRYPVYEGLEIALDAISAKAKAERQVAYIGRRQSRNISGLLASLL